MSFTYSLPAPPPRKRTPKEVAQSAAFSAEVNDAAELYNLQRRPVPLRAFDDVAHGDLPEFWGHVEAGLTNTPWMLDTNEVLLDEGRVRLITVRG